MISRLLSLSTALLPCVYFVPWRDMYLAPKWFVVYVSSLLLAGLLSISKRPLISFGRPWREFAFAAVLLFAASIYFNRETGYYRAQILDWFCFAIVIAAAYQTKFDAQRFSAAILFSFLGCLGVLAVSRAQIFSEAVVPWMDLSTTFHERNMMCEYVAICALASVSRMKLKTDRIPLMLCIAAFALCVTWMMFFLGRSAIVGFAVALCFLAGLDSLRTLARYRFRILSAFLILAVSGVFLHRFLRDPNAEYSLFEPELWRQKTQNTSVRQARYANTLAMIRERPWFGFGPGNFEFTYPVFANRVRHDAELSNETVIRSPHCGYLELASEWGVPAWIVLLIFLATFFRNARDRFFAAVLLFLATDALFAFPLETPYLFFIAALSLGASLAAMQADPEIHFELPRRFAFAIATVVVGFLTYSFTLNNHYESLDSTRASKRACEVYPEHWWTCLDFAERGASLGLGNLAAERLQKMLARMPYNLPALEFAENLAQDLDDRAWFCGLRTRRREVWPSLGLPQDLCKSR